MEKRESLKDGFKWIFTDGKERKPQGHVGSLLIQGWIFTDGKERKPQGWVQMDLY